MKKSTLNKELSHNLYSDDISNEKFKLPTYLILTENKIDNQNHNEINYANNISDAISIAILRNNSAIYRLNGTMGKGKI